MTVPELIFMKLTLGRQCFVNDTEFKENSTCGLVADTSLETEKREWFFHVKRYILLCKEVLSQFHWTRCLRPLAC
jgi:hypothetical protein